MPAVDLHLCRIKRIAAGIGAQGDLGGDKARIHDVAAGNRIGVMAQITPEVFPCPIAPDFRILYLDQQVILRLMQIALTGRSIVRLHQRQCEGDKIHLIAQGCGLKRVAMLKAVELIGGLQGAVQEQTQAGKIGGRQLVGRGGRYRQGGTVGEMKVKLGAMVLCAVQGAALPEPDRCKTQYNQGGGGQFLRRRGSVFRRKPRRAQPNHRR